MLLSFCGYMKFYLLLFIITFLIATPIAYWNLPYSRPHKLFNSKAKLLEKAKTLNKFRLMKAVNYFKNLDPHKSLQFYEHPKHLGLDLVVVIVTVKRKSKDVQKLGYFLQSAAAMDQVLKKDRNYETKKLMICNVDKDPEKHTDVEHASRYIPVIHRYSQNPQQTATTHERQKLYNKQKHRDRYEKETIDYMFCLENAYKLNSTYILLMEDDAVPYPDFLDVVKYTMDQKLNALHKQFAYIKLYYPQKWQGYANELDRILDVTSLAFVGAGVFVFIYNLVTLKRKSRHDVLMQYFIFLSGVVYFVLLALVIERTNVIELRRLSRGLYAVYKSPGCCTQSHLYSRHYIPSLIDHLHKTVGVAIEHTDIAIYSYITKNNVPAYHIEPNLFYHIGMYSSLVQDHHKEAEAFLKAPF